MFSNSKRIANKQAKTHTNAKQAHIERPKAQNMHNLIKDCCFINIKHKNMLNQLKGA